MDKNLLFRRQYFLCPQNQADVSAWDKFIDINKHYVLCANKELCITKHDDKENTIILLGYILDPFHPEFDNLNVLKNCLDKMNEIDDIFSYVKDKCGRYVLIIFFNNGFRIFHDTGGSKQIFYHIAESGQIWCASQPHFIADYLKINENKNILEDFNKTRLFKTSDYWFPGKITAYNDIFHLVPNHYLDLKLKNVFRYWPTEKIKNIEYKDCISQNTALLKGIFLSASKRFNLGFAISSGLDSRLLLSASRDVAQQIQYFTHSERETSTEDLDIKNICALLKILNLKHSLIFMKDDIDPDFLKAFKKNVYLARGVKGLNAFTIYKYFKLDVDNLVVIYGNIAEITKRDRYRYPQIAPFWIGTKVVTDMAHMSGSVNAFNEYKEWLKEAKKLTKYKINILDLMHWEHRVGSWGAMTFSEYDIAFNTLCPYNCLLFIENMLSIPYRYRTNPNYKLQHDLIRNLWKETLQIPINEQPEKAKRIFYNFLYITKLYDILKYLYILLIRRFKYDK